MNGLNRYILCLLYLLLAPVQGWSQLAYESGGELSADQEAFRVTHYGLDLRIDPSQQSISGSVQIDVRMVHPATVIALDLHPAFTIDKVERLPVGPESNPSGESVSATTLSVARSEDSKRFHVHLDERIEPDSELRLKVFYHGSPPVSDNPPWEGGFIWEETPSGDPWIGVTSQTSGAWIWWPQKDHPSDRPDSVTTRLTLPEGLVVASNGVLTGRTETGDGWVRWEWFSPAPISPYNITVNAAPYQQIRDHFQSITGEPVKLHFWHLPGHREKAQKLLEEAREQIRFLEELLGPYPFRNQKLGIAESPYLGMEHQTMIAYGGGYRHDNLFGSGAGFDELFHHELAHEWWGNLLVVEDWRHFWIHEGFATYMQVLYAEELAGKKGYRRLMNQYRVQIDSEEQLVPKTPASSREINRGGRGRDLYYKGAWILHTLRFYLGDDLFFESLRRFTYPDPDAPLDTAQSRYVETEDYLQLLNRLKGEELDWFFDTYLYSGPLPVLHVERTADRLILEWESPAGVFPMPVEVEMDGERSVHTPENGRIVLPLSGDPEIVIDPDGWLLMKKNIRSPLDGPDK